METHIYTILDNLNYLLNRIKEDAIRRVSQGVLFQF